MRSFLHSCRRVLFHNWRAKVGSLLVATVVWFLIKRDISHPPSTLVKPVMESFPRFP
ncbi:MAG: hypothetical protein JO117_07665 [Verrucomicrobia bacterium]|nr:hypothetical protein [Verrucomicrobiota bacterium]MBV9656929.1 hypothetical protein [Verrucomicrobiota bacterium]